MLISLNPPPEGIARLIQSSVHKAAKWLRDSATGEMWYWPAEQFNHAEIAEQFGIAEYTKGIVIPKEP